MRHIKVLCRHEDAVKGCRGAINSPHEGTERRKSDHSEQLQNFKEECGRKLKRLRRASFEESSLIYISDPRLSGGGSAAVGQKDDFFFF